MSMKINTTNTIKHADKHADAIAYFDPATDRVKVIPSADCKSGYFDEEKAVTVNKAAVLAAYDCIKLLNAREFIKKQQKQNAAAQPSAETGRVSDTVRTIAAKNAIDEAAS